MKIISNGFREALRGIRQLDAFITFESESGQSYILATENSKMISTELGSLLSAEQSYTKLEGEFLNSIKPMFNVELFKTICKSVEIDSSIEVPKNTWINCQIGVDVDGEYEYLDMGDYYIIETSYQADTRSYRLVGYDKMVESMIPYDLNLTYPMSIKTLLTSIFDRLNWEYELPTFVNQDKILTTDLFKEQDLTFRDVLDNISQVIVGNIYFDKKVAKIKYKGVIRNSTLLPFTIPQTINVETSSEDEIINEEDLKSTNVTINKKYGPVNALIISNNSVVLNNIVDSESIDENGKTEYNIKDNRILSYDSDTFITDMFNQINGFQYYLYDFETFGKLCYDPLDTVTIQIGEKSYNTLVLNDEIALTTGLIETMYVEEPEETTQEYIVNDKEEKKINDALISINKANAEIVLKVDSQGRIASATLIGNADEGTLIELKADQIKLEGYTTINNGFSIDINGNMSCNSGNIGGWTINNAGLTNSVVKLNSDGSSTIYTVADLLIIRNYINGRPYFDMSGSILAHYDLNHDGVVNSQDYVLLKNLIGLDF